MTTHDAYVLGKEPSLLEKKAMNKLKNFFSGAGDDDKQRSSLTIAELLALWSYGNVSLS
jgi:hypothetical protein